MTKKQKPAEVGLDVDYRVYSEVTREAREDSGDRDDTHSSYDIRGVYLNNAFPDITACFPVAVGVSVFLVYVVYSTGDSFGHDADGKIVFVDVFTTKEKAEACATAISEHAKWSKRDRFWKPLTKQQRKELDKKYADEYTVGYVRENGETCSLHCSWNGYFDSLSYANVESFTIASKTTIKGW